MVSVIVPIYNAENYLHETIKSVFSQTYTNWELILIDDGSTDSSYNIATEYVLMDKRVRLLAHEGRKNLGVSISRNLGIKSSKGTYIALLDSDDVWFSEKLEKQMQIFESCPEVSLVYTKLKTLFDINLPDFPEICGSGKVGMQDKIFVKMLNDEIWMPNSSVIFKKDVIKQVGFFEEKLIYQIEDHLFFTKCSFLYKTYFLDEILGYYRIHSTSYTVNTKWKKSIYEYFFSLMRDSLVKNKKLIISAFLKRLKYDLFS